MLRRDCPPCPSPAPAPKAGRTRARKSARPVLAPARKAGGFAGKKAAPSYGFRTKKRRTSRGHTLTGQVWLQGRWLTDLGFKGNAPYYVLYHNAADQPTGIPAVEVIHGRAPKGVTQRHVHKPADERKQVVIDLENKKLLDLFEGNDRVMIQLAPGHLIIRPEDIPGLVYQRRVACAERQQDGKPPLVGSCFTGAGFLDLAAEEDGYHPAFGIEIEEEYAGIYRANRWNMFSRDEPVPVHLGGVASVITANLENLNAGLPALLERGIDLLVGGIPCQPYSDLSPGATVIDYYEEAVKAENEADKALKAAKTTKQIQKAKKKRASANVRRQLVGLAPRFMQVVQHSNPLNVLVEQVSGFQGSQAHYELVEFLESQGYHVQWKVMQPGKMGWPAGRERFVLVATTDPANSFSWPTRIPGGKPLQKILIPPSKIPASLSRTAGGWFTLGEPKVKGRREARPGSYFWTQVGVASDGKMTASQIKTANKKRKAAGKAPLKIGLWQRKDHQPQIIGPKAKHANAVVKGYYSPDPAGPYVAHPGNSKPPGRRSEGWRPVKGDRYRMLTIAEIKELHGVRPDYALDVAVSAFGHEKAISPAGQCAVLGQGVVVPMFREVIERLPRIKAPRTRRIAANPSQDEYWRLWALGL
jgi:site-specific DNA-cytosine methylase